MRTLIEVCGKQIRIEGRVVRIARLEADTYHFLDDPGSLLDDLRRTEHRIDIFTFMQPVPETAPKFNYPMEWDNLAVLTITTFDHWRMDQIRSEARNRARQAEKKGVTIREVPFDEVLVRGIHDIYNECPVRQGRAFPHYGKDYETVYKEESTFLDSSIFLAAFFEEKLIGFVKMVADETWSQANLMNILSVVRHRDKAVTNALIAHAVRTCAERGIKYLVYQRFSYGKRREDGLSRFKEVNGFQRVDLPRFYVALTPLGSAALSLGLHRRLVHYIPESVAFGLRELRKAWYSRKFRSVTEA